MAEAALTRKDFVTKNDVRWCPGCGDYSILASIQNTFPKLGIPKEKFVIVSGIGCSSRFPYYMETYGFHTLHGRAPTVATGIKVTNPELSVWMVTGDGDGLSIGGNHLMHMVRRNLDIKILLFNNRIYGLTKGQYSPTSAPGLKTKTSPQGSIDRPVNPLEFALASGATFVARTIDRNPKHMQSVFERAAHHKGVSFIEIFQNCVIFNDKTFDNVYKKDVFDDNMLVLEDGQPLLYGKDKDKGIQIVDGQPQKVSAKDSLNIHESEKASKAYAYALASMESPDFPVPIGVFRQENNVATYEDEVLAQEQAIIDKNGLGDLDTLIKGSDYWEVH